MLMSLIGRQLKMAAQWCLEPQSCRRDGVELCGKFLCFPWMPCTSSLFSMNPALQPNSKFQGSCVPALQFRCATPGTHD